MLDCEWISCCEEEDEVAVSATVNEACRGISGETGIETRNNEILYDASDLFCIFIFWVAYCRQTELVFLFSSADMFLLYVFRDDLHLCPDINMICLAWNPASLMEEIAMALKQLRV